MYGVGNAGAVCAVGRGITFTHRTTQRVFQSFFSHRELRRGSFDHGVGSAVGTCYELGGGAARHWNP